MTITKHTIDATGKKIGRVATLAASYLIGKNRTDFQKNIVPNVEVEILNASKADIGEKKKSDKVYVHYTGYRGGLVSENLNDLIKRKDYSEVFKLAVDKMLPKNKLRKIMIKNLKVSE